MRPLRWTAAIAAAALLFQPIAARAAGVDLAIIDKSVAPGDDFFGFANGLWLKTAVIPPDRASWGAGAELVEKTNRRLADLIAEAGAGHPPPGSPARQVADFYAACAQSWRNKAREAALRRQILTDGHAPARYRADTVRNLDAWYAAFGAKRGQALYLAPADRVRMW